jgi:uncharacterized protein YcgI (DUF1989 family)
VTDWQSRAVVVDYRLAPGLSGRGRMDIDIVIPPGDYWSDVVPRRSTLRLIDLEGCQALDLLCYAADDPSERYSTEGSVKIGRWTCWWRYQTAGKSTIRRMGSKLLRFGW